MAIAGYSRTARRADNDRYYGRWHGSDISFNRIYKGRRLTDEECRTLCDGGLLTINVSHSGLSGYEMKVGLDGYEYVDSMGSKQIMVTIKPRERDFDMVNRKVKTQFEEERKASAAKSGSIGIPRDDCVDYFSDNDDSCVAAMLQSEQSKPILIKTDEVVSTAFGDVPVYELHFPFGLNADSASVSSVDEIDVDEGADDTDSYYDLDSSGFDMNMDRDDGLDEQTETNGEIDDGDLFDEEPQVYNYLYYGNDDMDDIDDMDDMYDDDYDDDNGNSNDGNDDDGDGSSFVNTFGNAVADDDNAVMSVDDAIKGVASELAFMNEIGMTGVEPEVANAFDRDIVAYMGDGLNEDLPDDYYEDMSNRDGNDGYPEDGDDGGSGE